MEVQVTYLLQVLGELYVENKMQADRLREFEVENNNLRQEVAQSLRRPIEPVEQAR